MAQDKRIIMRLIQAAFSRRPFSSLICWHGPRAAGAVAVTLDDGPNGRFTPVVLDLLRAAGAQATFFVEGQRVPRHPDLVRRMAAEGHEIGNHGFEHEGELCGQAERCRQALGACGFSTRLFRPPMGRVALRDLPGLWRRGHRVVLWSFDTRDSLRFEGKWAGPAPDYRGIGAGDIILMHDDNPLCVAELPALLDCLRRKNLRTATVSALQGALGHCRGT